MPTSRPDVIPVVCNYIKELKDIKSVLDIGCGFGKWGFLAREYIQIWNRDMKLSVFKNLKKNLRVDAVEICKDYINPLLKEIYNNIYIGDIIEKIDKLDDYDLIIMGDIIEHLSVKDSVELLAKLRKKARYLIITTPNYWEGRYRKIDGNDYEKHLSFWNGFPDNPKRIILNKINIVFYEQNKTSN